LHNFFRTSAIQASLMALGLAKFLDLFGHFLGQCQKVSEKSFVSMEKKV